MVGKLPFLADEVVDSAEARLWGVIKTPGDTAGVDSDVGVINGEDASGAKGKGLTGEDASGAEGKGSTGEDASGAEGKTGSAPVAGDGVETGPRGGKVAGD